jgi:YVTN family beta-propeller protein
VRHFSPLRTVLLAMPAVGLQFGACGAQVASAPPPSPRSSTSIALTADDRRLLVVNPDTDTVSILDLTGPTPTVVGELSVGANPRGIAVTHSGHKAYVANTGADTISVIDLSGPPRVLTTIAVGEAPHAVLIDHADARAFVANAGSDTLAVIDTTTDRVVHTVRIDAKMGCAPRALGYRKDHQRERLVVALSAPRRSVAASAAARIAVFDAAALDLIATSPALGASTPCRPCAIAMDPSATRAVVLSRTARRSRSSHDAGEDLVSVVDLAAVLQQPAPLRTKEHGATRAPQVRPLTEPAAVAFDPSGAFVWIAGEADSLWRVPVPGEDGTLAPASASPMGLDLDAIAGGAVAGRGPRAVVLDRAGRRVFVHNHATRSVTVVDARGLAILATVPTSAATSADATARSSG